MTYSKPPRSSLAALTLIEVTLVMAVLLGLISALFVGTGTYKKGTDRATCIQQIAKVQQAMRSFCNTNEYFPGDMVDLKASLIGPNGYYTVEPACPGDGVYSFYPNVVPPVGTPLIDCSVPYHKPNTTTGW